MLRSLFQRCASVPSLLPPRAPFLSLLLCAPHPQAPPSAAYSTITRRRRKELRKDAARETRRVLAFARLLDPLRVARAGVFQTLHRLGWRARAGERVGEDLVVDFALEEWAVAFEVVPASSFRLPGAPDASDDAGWGAGVPPPAETRPLSAGARATPPSATPYGSAPAGWLSPVRGLVLDTATASRHAAIRGRGWKLVCVAEPLWDFAATMPARVGSAHYARRDLLMSLVLPLAPFEARPPGSATGRPAGKAPAWAAGQSAAAFAADAKACVDAALVRRNAVSGDGGADGGADVEDVDVRAKRIEGARDASGAGRNRKERTAARATVRNASAVDDDTRR